MTRNEVRTCGSPIHYATNKEYKKGISNFPLGMGTGTGIPLSVPSRSPINNNNNVYSMKQ
nr:hypothetical protein Itr_chr14CG23130 [Ipomoea trifida]